jgi:hypothetical protein
MRIQLWLWLIIFWFSGLQAQTVKYANAFLDIGVGCRGLALSNATVASADDATAAYWNPAGLTGMRRDIQLAFMHNEHFAGIVKYDYGGLAIRFSERDAGAFTFIRSGVDDIPNTLELIDANGQVDYDRVKSFSAADYAFMFSYARKFKDIPLSIGGTVKVLHRAVGEFGEGWGFGLDAGLRWTPKKWRFGLMFRDISSTITNFSYNTETFRVIFAQTGNEIISNSTEIAVPRAILGAGYSFELPAGFKIQPEFNLTFTTDGRRNVLVQGDPISMDPSAGLEIGFKDMVFLRGGVGRFQFTKNVTPGGGFDGKSLAFMPTAGIGFRIKAVNIDYTLANFGSQLMGVSHVFSIRLDLKKGVKTTTP